MHSIVKRPLASYVCRQLAGM